MLLWVAWWSHWHFNIHPRQVTVTDLPRSSCPSSDASIWDPSDQENRDITFLSSRLVCVLRPTQPLRSHLGLPHSHHQTHRLRRLHCTSSWIEVHDWLADTFSNCSLAWVCRPRCMTLHFALTDSSTRTLNRANFGTLNTIWIVDTAHIALDQHVLLVGNRIRGWEAIDEGKIAIVAAFDCEGPLAAMYVKCL